MLGYASAQCHENLAIASGDPLLFKMSQAPSHQSPTEINGASLHGSAPRVVDLLADRCP